MCRVEKMNEPKQQKTKKKKPFKKIVMTGLGVMTLLYASNGFALRDTINTRTEQMIQKSVNLVTKDIGEATETLYKSLENTTDKTPYYDSMQETVSVLYAQLPPEYKAETLETILFQSPEELQELTTQQLYSSQNDDFKRQFIIGNLASLSDEELSTLRQEITTEYLTDKKEEFIGILQKAREKLEPLYEGIRNVFKLYDF